MSTATGNEMDDPKTDPILDKTILYNTVTLDAVIDLLIEKGVITKQQIKDRVAKHKRESNSGQWKQ